MPIASGTLAWAAYHPASRLFGPVTHRLPSADSLALTFDDGPNPALTPRLLQLLERNRALATFFVIGQWAQKCPTLIREIVERGHTLGNHTHTHPNLLLQSRSHIVQELASCQDVLADITAVRPTLMRPPYGARGPQLRAAIRETGLRHVVTWSQMGRDWTARGKRHLRENLGRVRGGDIVVLHDGFHAALGADREDTLRALEYWLPRWNDAGLSCVTLA